MEPTNAAQSPPETDPSDAVVRALKSTRSRFRTGLILGAVITAAVILLIVSNGESAHLHWLAFTFHARLWLMLLLTAVAGAVVWELVKAGLRRARRLRAQRRDALKLAQTMTPPDTALGQ
jgi:uncharacterized integral membrane protein